MYDFIGCVPTEPGFASRNIGHFGERLHRNMPALLQQCISLIRFGLVSAKKRTDDVGIKKTASAGIGFKAIKSEALRQAAAIFSDAVKQLRVTRLLAYYKTGCMRDFEVDLIAFLELKRFQDRDGQSNSEGSQLKTCRHEKSLRNWRRLTRYRRSGFGCPEHIFAVDDRGAPRRYDYLAA
jgi:hypothetical protein